MAIFNLSCECGLWCKKFADTFDTLTEQQKTCKCGKIMKRNPNPPSTHVKERLDNGVMSRALERYSDAERLFQERHDKADPLAGLSNRS
jgi:hypothetical protein